MEKKFLSRNQKGFTLVELISIMIILGVLGSVAGGYKVMPDIVAIGSGMKPALFSTSMCI